MRHVRGFDVVRPLSIGMLVFMMLPLVFLPLASIFIFGTSNGLDKFLGCADGARSCLCAEALDGHEFLGHRFQCSLWTVRRLRLSRYNFWGRNALIVTISLPTAIPTAVAGFALLFCGDHTERLAGYLTPHGFR